MLHVKRPAYTLLGAGGSGRGRGEGGHAGAKEAGAYPLDEDVDPWEEGCAGGGRGEYDVD